MPKTPEEVAVMGADAPFTMSDDTIVTGKSGKGYRLTNVFSELTGDQQGAIEDLLEPVLPKILEVVRSMVGGAKGEDGKPLSNNAVGAMFAETIAELVVSKKIDRRVYAILMLPEDAEYFDPSRVDEVAADLGHKTFADRWAVLVSFFSSAGSFFQAISREHSAGTAKNGTATR